MYSKALRFGETFGEHGTNTKDVRVDYYQDGYISDARTYKVVAQAFTVVEIHGVRTLKLARTVGRGLAEALVAGRG